MTSNTLGLYIFKALFRLNESATTTMVGYATVINPEYKTFNAGAQLTYTLPKSIRHDLATAVLKMNFLECY